MPTENIYLDVARSIMDGRKAGDKTDISAYVSEYPLTASGIRDASKLVSAYNEVAEDPHYAPHAYQGQLSGQDKYVAYAKNALLGGVAGTFVAAPIGVGATLGATGFNDIISKAITEGPEIARQMRKDPELKRAVRAAAMKTIPIGAAIGAGLGIYRAHNYVKNRQVMDQFSDAARAQREGDYQHAIDVMLKSRRANSTDQTTGPLGMDKAEQALDLLTDSRAMALFAN